MLKKFCIMVMPFVLGTSYRFPQNSPEFVFSAINTDMPPLSTKTLNSLA